MKEVLILGAGLVTRPHVRYLLASPGFHVTVASRTVEKALALVAGFDNGTALALNVNDDGRLRQLIANADLVVSLLPYIHHARIARLCIMAGKDMVTTSYVSDDMADLDQDAKEAGVLLLNEVGVDPGIDHMSAMQVIHRVASDDGFVSSFKSFCGGLPAPDANTNPFGYKFSWSPRGVLMAGKNAGRWLQNGREINVPGSELFQHHWPVEIEGMGTFEGYPNRDSLPYRSTYSLPKIDTMFRGTLRYPGWCETLFSLVHSGWLSEETADLSGMTFGQMFARLLGAPGQEPKAAAISHLKLAEDSATIKSLEWLGLFGTEPLPIELGSPLDVLETRMLEKMKYREGERDMLLMQHEFIAEYPDRREKVISTMVDFGEPGGDSSMSKTVGLPAAIAARLVLEGKINMTGVHQPVIAEFYDPILDELSRYGIHFTEKVESLSQ